MSKCFVIFKDMSINFKVNTKVGLQNQKINLPPGTSLITVCEKIAEIPEKYFSDLYDKDDDKNMFSRELISKDDVVMLKTISHSRMTQEIFDYLSTQSIEDAKSVNGTDAKFEIVFSAKASDVLTMSTRSVWTSCQNWLNPDNESYSYKAINSAISKYVAIIYATNNKDFRKRGEQMLARSVVLLLQNERTNKPAIFLERAYGEFGGSKYFYDKFKQSLKDHFAGTGIEILEDRPSGDYFFPLESSGQPYFDTWMRTEKAD